MAKKYAVRIGKDADAVFVKKVKSYAVPARGFEAKTTVADIAEARAFTYDMAQAVAKRNGGHVVEIREEKADAK